MYSRKTARGLDPTRPSNSLPPLSKKEVRLFSAWLHSQGRQDISMTMEVGFKGILKSHDILYIVTEDF